MVIRYVFMSNKYRSMSGLYLVFIWSLKLQKHIEKHRNPVFFYCCKLLRKCLYYVICGKTPNVSRIAETDSKR